MSSVNIVVINNRKRRHSRSSSRSRSSSSRRSPPAKKTCTTKRSSPSKKDRYGKNANAFLNFLGILGEYLTGLPADSLSQVGAAIWSHLTSDQKRNCML